MSELDALDEKAIAEVLADTHMSGNDLTPDAVMSPLSGGSPPLYRAKVAAFLRDLEARGLRIVRSR